MLASLTGVALGQTAPSSPVVGDVPIAGGTERVLFLAGQQPRAIVVLLPGGEGIIGLDEHGGVRRGGNFLVRTRDQWVAQGFGVVLPDAPNETSLLGQRHLTAYADAIGRAIDFGRSHANLPVWLIVSNRYDTCSVSPPGDAPTVLAALTRSSRRELLMVESNQIRSDPCKAMSPHGYLGIESVVVQRISEWIRAAGSR